MMFVPQRKAKGGPGTSFHVIDVKLHHGEHRLMLQLCRNAESQPEGQLYKPVTQ